MRVPCNLTEEEERAAFSLFHIPPTLEELEEAQNHFQRHIFYETWGRRDFRECWCENCGHFEIHKSKTKDPYMDDLFEFHHGDMVCCPMCGEEMELVALGRMRTFNSLRQEIKACFIRANAGALLITTGFLNMEYSRDELSPWPYFVPNKLYYFAPGKRCSWACRTYNYWGCHDEYERRWEKRATVCEPFPDGYNMGGGYLDGAYHVIGWQNIEASDLKYCLAQDFFEDIYHAEFSDLYQKHKIRGLIPFLAEYTRRPQIEMLLKLGHSDVVKALIEGQSMKGIVNWRAKRPYEFFRLSKSEYKAFASNGGELKDLKAWKTDSGEYPVSFEQFMWYRGVFGHNTARFFKAYGADLRREKIARWFDKQKTNTRYGKYEIWQDLLRMEQAVGNDITHDNILMPANLWQRHDELVPIFNEIQKAHEEEMVKSYGKIRYKELKKRFAYSDGQLSVVIPTCAEEIENEGKALKHCVAGYADRHIKGVRTIVFLRWVCDIRTPYMTIELNVNQDKPVSIMQIHGYRNDVVPGQAQPRHIHEEFLDEWLGWINSGSRRTSTGKPILPRAEKTREDKSA